MANQINLDDLRTYQRFDPQGMLNHLHNFPGMCEQAWQSATGFKLPAGYAGINQVVVLGMGGSAIGGDLISSLSLKEAKIPILVCRDYSLPEYVGEGTLVVASSYSGDTEETLSAFKDAFDTPCRKLAITTGGKLKEFCKIEDVPVFSYVYHSQPRAALPYSLFSLLGILQNLGVLSDKSLDIAETLANLKGLAGKIGEQVPLPQNPAKSLAQKLVGRLVIMYGAGITTEVAHRWKTQINENSKTTAFYEFFSELNHNSIVGYSLPEELTRQSMVVMLSSDLLHERISYRYNVTQKLLDEAGIYYQVLTGNGRSALSQMLTLILMGDYVSYYLAMLNQVDPTPVEPIAYLKAQLVKM